MADLNDWIAEGGALHPPKLGDSVGSTPNKELMAEARMVLSGNWGMSVLGYVLYVALVLSFYGFILAAVFFVGMISGWAGGNVEAAVGAIDGVVQLVQLFLSGAFMVGFCGYFLIIAQEGEARLEGLFMGFSRFWTSFWVYFLSHLFIFLWTLLLIIPGIIATFRYAMIYFVVADDREVGSLEAIRLSSEMMKGNKWKLFCLHWRFFGWGLLASCFTLGIGFFWLVPYMQTSLAKFYENVK